MIGICKLADLDPTISDFWLVLGFSSRLSPTRPPFIHSEEEKLEKNNHTSTRPESRANVLNKRDRKEKEQHKNHVYKKWSLEDEHYYSFNPADPTRRKVRQNHSVGLQLKILQQHAGSTQAQDTHSRVQVLLSTICVSASIFVLWWTCD